MRRLAVLAVVALVGIGACGRKAPPIAPQLVRPEPPTELAAASVAEGVRLTWIRPLRYSGGQRMNDLGGFTIERAHGEGTPATFAPVATVQVSDQERFRKERHQNWIDQDVQPGERYLYRVTAFTLDGYRSAPAGPVAVTVNPPPPPH